jgi:hypothetical protein
MIKNQKRINPKLKQPTCMIAAGMKDLVPIFAAGMSAAVRTLSLKIRS